MSKTLNVLKKSYTVHVCKLSYMALSQSFKKLLTPRSILLQLFRYDMIHLWIIPFENGALATSNDIKIYSGHSRSISIDAILWRLTFKRSVWWHARSGNHDLDILDLKHNQCLHQRQRHAHNLTKCSFQVRPAGGWGAMWLVPGACALPLTGSVTSPLSEITAVVFTW